MHLLSTSRGRLLSYTVAAMFLLSAACLTAPAFAQDEPQSATGLLTEESVTTQSFSADIYLQTSPLVAQGMATSSANPAETFAIGNGAKVTKIAGANRYATAAREAEYAFDSSDYVMLASGEDFADALSVTGLAGAFDCPILLVRSSTDNSEAAEALASLKPSHILTIGGQARIPDEVVSSLHDSLQSETGIDATTDRISGDDRYGTQLAIYDYGAARNLWTSGFVLVATGTNYPDALSAGSLAFARKAPIFFVDGTGTFPEAQASALLASSAFKTAVILGGTSSVSDDVLGTLAQVTASGGGAQDGSATIRLGGATRYATSAMIAQWSVANGYLSWDNAAFTTGTNAADALAGSPMQGRCSSVILLVSNDDVATSTALDSSKIATGIRIIGGVSSISFDALRQIYDNIGIFNTRALIFTDFIATWCDDDSHGYDQGENRWGPDCDCSSLVYMAGIEAGYISASHWGWGNTRTIYNDFTAAGWTFVPYSSSIDLSTLPTPTILLNTVYHVETVIGDGESGAARGNEYGGDTGGQTGDQTGSEVSRTTTWVSSNSNYVWNWVGYPPAS